MAAAENFASPQFATIDTNFPSLDLSNIDAAAMYRNFRTEEGASTAQTERVNLWNKILYG